MLEQHSSPGRGAPRSLYDKIVDAHTIRAVDDHNLELFNYTVPFEFEIDVTEVMERAFVIGDAHDGFRARPRRQGRLARERFPSSTDSQ